MPSKEIHNRKGEVNDVTLRTGRVVGSRATEPVTHPLTQTESATEPIPQPVSNTKRAQWTKSFGNCLAN